MRCRGIKQLQQRFATAACWLYVLPGRSASLDCNLSRDLLLPDFHCNNSSTFEIHYRLARLPTVDSLQEVQ